jgi:hypothetical protein
LSKLVVSSGEKVIREASNGSSWGTLSAIDNINRIYQANGSWLGLADVNLPKVEFVLIADSWREEEWAKDLLVHSV